LMPPTVPGSPPRLLSGRSARRWAVLVAASMVPPLIPLFAMGVTAALAPNADVRSTLIALEFAMIIVWVVFGMIPTAVMHDRAMRRELRARYTTEFRGHQEYWLLDDKTGAVLRQPGERTIRRQR
jgi:hypothetical protein